MLFCFEVYSLRLQLTDNLRILFEDRVEDLYVFELVVIIKQMI